MLLKFAFQDFLDDRKFKNTTKVNIRNYLNMLGDIILHESSHGPFFIYFQ
ncbi:hypothetical protein SAMN04487896_3411 [Paenibacillus sp. ov031]|nr:hypothetical protein SAMN04487896_3411 [Paenibacillus sp. ov031]